MTQEEKAKAYDEALEKARKRVAVEPQDHTDAILKDIFPQLRESEDERIRKAIIELLKEVEEDETYTGRQHIPDMLSYLEKQKEQKPAENNVIIPQFHIGDYIKPKAYNEEHLIKDINKNGYVLDIDVIIPFKDEDVWELAKQKPAEWSEEDETIIEGAYNALEVYGHTKLANKLKSLRPQPSWKPSEEQMEALRRAVHKLAKTDVADSVRLSIMYDHLKEKDKK